MIGRTLILIAVLLAMASSAQAQKARFKLDRAENWEFSIQTRYTVEQEHSGEGGSTVKLHDDLGWGFGFAYNMNQNWSLGFGFTWRSIPYTATIVDQVVPQTTHDYSGNLDLTTFGLSGMWNVLKGKVTPYVTGATGWTLIDTNIYAGSATGCWWDPWLGPVCGTFPTSYGKDAWTFAIGAGVRADLLETVFLRGGYEYARDNAGSVEATSMIRVDFGWLY
jgi:opacity protein-like surface antigen